MNTKFNTFNWLLGLLVITFMVLAIGAVIWPNAGVTDIATPAQLGFFFALSLIEAMLFSVGLMFLFDGFRTVKKSPAPLRLIAWLYYISTSVMLLSWWPHDNFHRTISENDLQRLLYLEYGFHFTLIIAGLAIAYSFFRIFYYIRETGPEQA